MVAVSRLLAVADRGGRGLMNTVTRMWTLSTPYAISDALSPPVSFVEARAEGLPPITVAYERHGAGEPVVLLHGLGLNRRVWDPIVPLLAAEREVIAIDLPGFGQSPEWPESVPRDLPAAAAGLGAVFAALGIERPHVVGHSLGGLIALKLGQAGLARSVTALAPAGFWNETERRYAFAVLTAAHRVARRLPGMAVRRLTETHVARAILTGMIYADPAKCPPGAVDTCLRALRDAAGFEATLRAGRSPDLFTGRIEDVPVTIAWGRADRILLPRQASRAMAMLPTARLIWLPGCGHIPMNDEPDLIADVILRATQATTRANL
jgi:pimeloyl-ACP methyl ester carboxylesterase